MLDRSSARHSQHAKTPQPVVRKIVHLRWKHRLGPVQIAAKLDMPASTVHAVLVRCRLNRLSHIDRVTGDPARRYERERPEEMIHVDVTKIGNIPDGGGWRFGGLEQGYASRQTSRDRAGSRNKRYQAKLGNCFVHTVIDDYSRVPTPKSMTTRRPSPRSVSWYRAVAWFAERGGSPSSRSFPTTAPPTSRTCGATAARTSTSPISGPGHDAHRPPARSNGSTGPWPTAGPTSISTTPKTPDGPRWQDGCTSTTTTGPTQPSVAFHPSAS